MIDRHAERESLLGRPSVSLDRSTVANLSIVIRQKLSDIFDHKIHNFGALEPMDIPDDWRCYDLQSVLKGVGFQPLATEEVMEGRGDEVYSAVDFSTPIHWYESVPGRARFSNPAVSIAPSEAGLRLVFGSLISTPSGWRITNNNHLVTRPESLIKPSGVTYFKCQ